MPTPSSSLRRARLPLVLVVLGVPGWFLFGAKRDSATAMTSVPEAVGREVEAPAHSTVELELDLDLDRAIELFEDGLFDEARGLLERVLAAAPELNDARHRLGLVLMELGELERAEGLLARAADSEPENAAFVFGLAQVVGSLAARSDNPLAQFSLGTRSKKLLDRAIELDPTLVEARLGRILFYLLAPALLGGGIERARADVLAIAEVDERAGLFAEGWLAEEDGDFARAEELHRRAIELDPDYAHARFRLGYLVLGQERWADAREQFEACCELEPRDPRSHQGLARAELGLGDAGAAIASHLRAIGLDPAFAPSIFGLGKAYAARGSAGDAERAREHFTRYLELEDEGKAAEEARAWLAERARR